MRGKAANLACILISRWELQKDLHSLPRNVMWAQLFLDFADNLVLRKMSCARTAKQVHHPLQQSKQRTLAGALKNHRQRMILDGGRPECSQFTVEQEMDMHTFGTLGSCGSRASWYGIFLQPSLNFMKGGCGLS
jgi:hypothetical protein